MLRQMHEAGIEPTLAAMMLPMTRALRLMKEELFGAGVKVELHHRPALVNRKKHYYPNGDFSYIPGELDPDYLVYLPADEHDIETRVRGPHGQYSDLALRRKRKRIEQKKHKRKHKWARRTIATRRLTRST
jgi:hypothetical protein